MSYVSHRVFFFHANASAVGGHLTYPLPRDLKTRGVCSLAQAGGHSSARVHKLRYDQVLSVEHAQTHVSGAHRPEGGWTTLVTTVVDGFDLLGVVTADRIVARLSVEHPQDGYNPKVTAVGSHFDNLRIGGVPVNVKLDSDLFRRVPSGTYPDGPWLKEPSLVSTAVRQSQKITGSRELADGLRHRYAWIESERERAEKGYLVCSLVEEIEGRAPGQTCGHIVSIPEFGTLFLGELEVAHGSFRLSMLRAELGCSVDGDVSAGDCYSNGRPMP